MNLLAIHRESVQNAERPTRISERTDSDLRNCGPAYNDVRITCSGTISTTNNALGLVFGYRDALNFWVELYTLKSPTNTSTIEIWEVAAGVWTQRSTQTTTITGSTPFTMWARVRNGGVEGYSGAIPAGKIGLWSSNASGNSFDNFYAGDIGGNHVAVAGWKSDKGAVQIDLANNNALEVQYESDPNDNCVPYTGFRGTDFISTFSFKWNGSSHPGGLICYLDPRNWVAFAIPASGSKVRICTRVGDGAVGALATSASALSLTPTNCYAVRLVVAGGTARIYINTGGGWSTARVTGTVDSDFDAGYTGLFVATNGGVIQPYRNQ